MPSKSKAQKHFMNAIAHNKDFAKKVGVPQKVGKDFTEADKKRSEVALRKLPSKVSTKRGKKWQHRAR